MFEGVGVGGCSQETRWGKEQRISCHCYALKFGVLVFLSVNLQSALLSESMTALEYPRSILPRTKPQETPREGQAFLLLKDSVKHPQIAQSLIAGSWGFSG